jgi:flagellar biosynthesis protein FlhB
VSDQENSAEDRNLPASEKRIKDARADGRVARSKELASFLLLGAALFALIGLGPVLFNDSLQIMSQGLNFDHAAISDSTSMGLRLVAFSGAAVIAAVPILGLLLLAAIAAPLALSGWNFTWKPVMPNFGKLDPVAGIGRIFDKHGLIEMAKAALIAVALAAATTMTLLNGREEFSQLASIPLAAGISKTGSMLLMSLAVLVGVVAVAAMIDVPAQLWRHHASLKMTSEEVKRESKESDGDPHIKARIRAQQREISRRRMMDAIPTADVIVTNPTHFAVALAYHDGKMRAPTVVAKGADLIALRIREIAAKHNVPVMEQPALARALHRHAEIGEEVPFALYNAVAQVLAYVYQLKRLAPGAILREPGTIDVPTGLDPQESDR